MSDYDIQQKNIRLENELTMMKTQMNFMMTMMMNTSKQAEKNEVNFENLLPTETLAEMMNRLGGMLTWGEVDTYSDSEDYAYEILYKWFISKPIEDRPVRYSNKEWFIFEKIGRDENAVRKWNQYSVTDVVSKTFERLNRICWGRVEELSRKGQIKIRNVGSDFENVGDDIYVLMRLSIIQKILSKDEGKLFGFRSQLLRKLSKILGSS